MSQTFTFDDSLNKYLTSRSAFMQQLDGHCDKLVVGIAIIQNNTSSGPSRILYVQRSSTEHLYPDIYELPGGKVDEDDVSILHGAAREAVEETSLQVTHFLGEFQSLWYTIERVYDGKPIMQTSLQINLVAKIDGDPDVKLNPEEHQAYVWVAEEEVEPLPSTEEMKQVMKNAFAFVNALSDI
ncbi:NUDIX hydrolase domain-like protein [Flagelloscypha sp. PMI_526]|nr:NUDIX hydrolase domain-like protein [Flagelloscypha sp. PMI_526]